MLNTNEMKHNVIYSIGDMKVKAELTQKDLRKLLLNDKIQLISVNAPTTVYRKRRKRKGDK